MMCFGGVGRRDSEPLAWEGRLRCLEGVGGWVSVLGWGMERRNDTFLHDEVKGLSDGIHVGVGAHWWLDGGGRLERLGSDKGALNPRSTLSRD